jgi:hypothetical protein
MAYDFEPSLAVADFGFSGAAESLPEEKRGHELTRKHAE